MALPALLPTAKFSWDVPSTHPCHSSHLQPAGKPSWDVFAEILEKCNIVTTPGSGFGPAGEGFVRASAFGSRENIMEAVARFKAVYGKK